MEIYSKKYDDNMIRSWRNLFLQNTWKTECALKEINIKLQMTEDKSVN